MSHRMQITLTDRQYERLQEESERTGMSIAELTRRAVEERYGTVSTQKLLEALDRSFGTWADRDFDGATYQKRMRTGLGKRLKKLGAE